MSRVKSKAAVLVAVFIAAAGVIALSAFFYNDFYEETEVFGAQEIFLENFFIDFKYENFDESHLLGEPFPLQVRVQYDADIIEVATDSLEDFDFAPFEKVSEPVITNKKIELKDAENVENIWELTYSVDLIAINPIPGEAYEIPPMVLEYIKVQSNLRTAKRINIAPPDEIRIGTYNVAHLRPIKGKIIETTEEKQTRYKVASGLLVLSAMLLLGKWAHETKREQVSAQPKTISKIEISEFIARHRNQEWLKLKDAKERMYELESFAFTLATENQLVESPFSFWTNSNENWDEMLNNFAQAYSDNDVEYQQVIDTVDLIEELIVSKITHKESKLFQNVFD